MHTTPPLPPFFAKHFNLIVASLLVAIVLGLCASIGWTTPAALVFFFLTGWLVVPFAIVRSAIDQPDFWQPGIARLAIGLAAVVIGLALLPRVVRRIRDLAPESPAAQGNPGRPPQHRLLVAGMAAAFTSFLVSAFMVLITLSHLLTPTPPTTRPTSPRSEFRMHQHLRNLALETWWQAQTEDRLPATMVSFIRANHPHADLSWLSWFHHARHPADPPGRVIYIGGLDTRLHRDVPVVVSPPPAPGATWLAATMNQHWMALTDAEWQHMVPEWKAMLEGSDCRWPPILDPVAHGFGISWTRIGRDGIEH